MSRVRNSKLTAVLAALLTRIAFSLVDVATGASVVDETKATMRTLILLVGAPGEEAYATEFFGWAREWLAKGSKAEFTTHWIGWKPTDDTDHGARATSAGADGDGVELARLKSLLEKEAKGGSSELWMILLGHGTFNGREAKFNLPGPDLSSAEFAEMLKPFTRPLVVVNCSSASAPFLQALTGKDRAIITATRSGSEVNFARLGKYMTDVVASPAADLDKDGQTSLLESFLFASRGAQDFYRNEGRLASEHALLDDNGDGQGTPSDWFRGIRAQKKPAKGHAVDGQRAHQFHFLRGEAERALTEVQRSERDQIESSIEKLREEKSALPEDDYYARLESLLLRLARLYHSPSKP